MSRLKPRACRIIGAFSAATLWSATGCAADPPAAEPAATPPAQAAGAPRTDAEQNAVARAQQALEAKQQWIPGLTLESVTATEWSDSSLGCRKPGVSYMQVITSGYTVKFVGKDARREVHVTDKSAVVCSGLIRGALRTPATSPRVPLRYLNAMIDAASADLAMQLGTQPEAIKLISWQPVQLPERVLRCEVAADPEAPAVPGYKILLSHRDRVFPYHSDLHSVFACPKVERN